MDMDEAIRLSEARDLNIGNGTTFATVKTPMNILIFTGKKSELNAIIGQFDPQSYVYWRSNQVKGKDVHRVILKDGKAATYARMFSDGEVRHLTIGELAEARNEIDVPWLPSNKKFLDDRDHDGQIAKVAQYIGNARFALEMSGHPDMAEEMSAVIVAVNSLKRRRP